MTDNTPSTDYWLLTAELSWHDFLSNYILKSTHKYNQPLPPRYAAHFFVLSIHVKLEALERKDEIINIDINILRWEWNDLVFGRQMYPLLGRVIRVKAALAIIAMIKETLKRKWEEECDVRVTSRSSPLSPDLSRFSENKNPHKTLWLAVWGNDTEELSPLTTLSVGKNKNSSSATLNRHYTRITAKAPPS